MAALTARMCSTRRDGVPEMLLAGITCVGEFIICTSTRRRRVADPNLLSREILRAAHDVGIRIALLEGGLDARVDFAANRRAPARARFTSAEQFLREAEALRVGVAAEFPADEAWLGVAPQSLAAVPIDQFKAIATTRTRNACGMHTHVGTQAEESAACVADTVRPPSCCWLSTAGRQAVSPRWMRSTFR